MSTAPGLSTSHPGRTTGGPIAGRPGEGATMPPMSVGLIVLIVLAALCAILGAIYAYLYYTRINPRSARARNIYSDPIPTEEDGERKSAYKKKTHMLLFHHNQQTNPPIRPMTFTEVLTPLPDVYASHPRTATGDPAATSDSGAIIPRKSVGLIILIVVAALCAILGAIYAYLYYTRINPRSARARKYSATTPQEEEGDNRSTHVHMFLFRKS